MRTFDECMWADDKVIVTSWVLFYFKTMVIVVCVKLLICALTEKKEFMGFNHTETQ